MNPTNVLWDGARVWLVDWDESGLTHPYYDLAVLSMFLRLDDAVALDLLARQENAPISRQQAETFRALRRLGAILCGMMFFRLAGDLMSVVPQRVHEAPTLLQFYARLFTGELALRSPIGQATFGAAMLKEAIG
jgi:aminoglycoside phosphotransferase (APT) family kinase protein